MYYHFHLLHKNLSTGINKAAKLAWKVSAIASCQCRPVICPLPLCFSFLYFSKETASPLAPSFQQHNLHNTSGGVVIAAQIKSDTSQRAPLMSVDRVDHFVVIAVRSIVCRHGGPDSIFWFWLTEMGDLGRFDSLICILAVAGLS